jgi:hypothetical protein
VTARTTILLLFCVAMTAAGCGASAPEKASAPTAARPPALYTVGRSLFGLGRGRVELAAPPVASLAGWLTPVAVPSADRRYVAYNAWTELREEDPALSWEDQGIEQGDPLARPSLRLYDSTAGGDELFEDGAFSLAWRQDGAVAYFKGAERDYRAGIPYVGRILVRSSVDALPETWTPKQARYIVAGWAGDTLIAYEELEGEALDVLALDGPGRVRVLAHDSSLVAIRPDGTQVLLEHGPENGKPALRVLDVSDGSEAAALELTAVDPSVGLISYSGDWDGDLAVAASASGLAFFRIQDGAISLADTIRAAGGLVAEPHFAGPGRTRVTAWASDDVLDSFLDCDLPSRSCRRVVPVPEANGVRGFPAWRRPVYNPSRPLEGER